MVSGTQQIDDAHKNCCRFFLLIFFIHAIQSFQSINYFCIRFVGQRAEGATNRLNYSRSTCRKVQKEFYDGCHVFDPTKYKRRLLTKHSMFRLIHTKRIKHQAQSVPAYRYCNDFDCSKRNKSVHI